MNEIVFQTEKKAQDLHYSVPKTMKAAILTQQKNPLEIVDNLQLPKHLGVGQVLVKVYYSGICGSQLGEIDGVKGVDKYLPHLLGHEGSGMVLQVGPGVKHVKAGDKVVLHWRKGLGIEANPATYEWNGQKVNAGWVTTFNDYAIVSENRVTPISQDSNMKVAALFGCAVTTGFGVINNNAKLKTGESVVVFGSGGIGLNMIQAAALVNAYPIIAVDFHQNRLDLAKEMGATHTLQAPLANPKEDLLNLLEGQKADVFIDNTGKPAIIEMGYQLVKSEGRVILVGVPAADQNINIHSLDLHFGKKLIGSHGGDAMPHLDIPLYNKMYMKNKLALNPLITHTFPLHEINKAISAMRSGEISGRCMIEMNHDE